MSDNILSEFLDNDTEENRRARQEEVDNASSEQRVRLTKSGTYLMEVRTFAFPDKNTDQMRTSPEIRLSEHKKSLQLSINLSVVDGTPQVPKGASEFVNITLSPAKGADRQKIEKTMRMMKPQIVALTGETQIQITTEWIENYLMPKFKEKEGGGYEIVKDHKMKNKVMVTFEDDEYNGKPTLNMVSLRKAEEGDKSETNVLQEEVSQQATENEGEIDPKEALITGEQVDTPPVGDVPDVSTVPDEF